MIHLTKLGATFRGSENDLSRLSAEFDRQYCLRLPQFLSSDLLSSLQAQIEAAEFYERVHEHGGNPPPTDLCMKHNSTSGILYYLLNDPVLFDLIQRLTGCNRIGCFAGAVYRLVPGRHYDSWHDDVNPDDRMIAMSLNFSSGVYSGGVLQIRDKKSQAIVHEVSNTGVGDAVIFRISRKIEHRVTRLEGTIARTAYAGWFQARPDYLSVLKNGNLSLHRNANIAT